MITGVTIKRYYVAYAAWFAGVLTMAAIALAWYRHVEGIGLTELAARFVQDAAPDEVEEPAA